MFLIDGHAAASNVTNVIFASHWITVVSACVLMTGKFVRSDQFDGFSNFS